jgi:putative DNA primase/helicase
MSTASPIERVLAALEREGSAFQRNGVGWRAQCPSHDDRNPSLTITEREGGGVLLHCHAGCSLEQVLATLQLTKADLFASDQAQTGSPGAPRNGARGPEPLPADAELQRWAKVLQSSSDVLATLRERKGWTAEALASLGVGWDGERVTIPVHDGVGQLLTVCRYLPNARVKMRASRGRPRGLFPAPESVEGEELWIVEGEPDAISASVLGLPALAVPGVGWARKIDVERFRKFKRIIVLFDCDDPGRRAAATIADRLAAAGLEVRAVDLDPGREDGHDLGDELLEAVASGGVQALHDLLETMAGSTPAHHAPVDTSPPVESTAVPSVRRNLTDLGNAERIGDQHAEALRYVPELGSWHAWDGRLWIRDTDGAAERAAKRTVRAIYVEASAAPSDETRKLVADHAKRSESAPRIRAALELAKSDRRLIARAEQLNAKPWLLTCANGTVDLRTGELRAATPSDLITLGVSIPFEPNAPAPRWLQFLEEVFDRDQDLIAFLQRWAGYCLTGETREQCFAILYGNGNNGKSTLVDALRLTAGEFAHEARFDTFGAVKVSGREPREDLARLRSARMVVTSEPGSRRPLDTETVKKLTGGEQLVCRELYGQPFAYKPSFKLMVQTNHRPRISADDDAMWRRVRLIPFEQDFEGREDKTLPEKLEAEQAGILRWAVDGAVAWYRNGLGSASAITDATVSYRADEDQVGRFLADCCERDPEKATGTSVLRSAYEDWCEREGERPLAANTFGTQLKRHGITKRDATASDGAADKRVYTGVAL